MDFHELLDAVDKLPPADLEKLFDHVKERRQQTLKIWTVPAENIARLEEITRPLQADAAKMSEEEINDLIDEAIAEVRRERKAKNSR